MSQPQNPQNPPLIARLPNNTTGEDLIQVLNSGSGIIYRLNQFQAIWYAGVGNPTTIPGQLINNLYLDTSTGNIWELVQSGPNLVWTELSSGGGGGGGNAVVLSTTLGTITGIFNSSNTTFTLLTTPSSGPNTLLFLNGIYQVQGTDYSLAGTTVTMSIAPNPGGELVAVINASVSPAGVTSLNLLTGALTVAGGTGIGVAPSGSNIVVTNDGVTTLNTLSGVVAITAGSGISVANSGNNVVVTNTGGGGGGGVTSLNTLTGGLSIVGGSNVTVTPSGSNITINASGAPGPPGTSNVPWLDAQNYNAIPKAIGVAQSTTTATTVGGSPNVTIGSAIFPTNGGGVCIWKAGAATAQSTPVAPTVTSPAVTGSQTLNYKCVGYDALGGLTAASPAGQVTSAPTVFAPNSVAITSISQTTGVVTANFASALNNTVSANMTIHITGVTGIAGVNGVWQIATAPSTTQVTFSLAGNAGSGGVSGAKGRISNAQQISAITRSSAGVISITTAQTHNWTTQAGNNPTIVIVEGCTPADLNGEYVIATASGSSVTCNTGNFTAVTGVVVAGSSTATVYEFTTVACPALSGTTLGYYIYSDSPNPGGSLTLIGKTIYGDVHFADWGPAQAGGYTAPAYVPTTAPSVAQNQLFSTTIASGAGTTNLVLSANVPTSIAALGATIMFDDGPCLANAFLAITSFNFPGTKDVNLTPPYTPGIVQPCYIFNSPLSVPAGINLLTGAGMLVNETITFGQASAVLTPFGSAFTINPQFSQRNYSFVSGLGNPMFSAGESFTMDGLGFTNLVGSSQGQNLAQITNLYSQVSNCSFQCGNGTNVGLMYNGSCSSAGVSNCNFSGFSKLIGNAGVAGQSGLGPPIPVLWLRASDNPLAGGIGPAQFHMSGLNTFNGRGILIDGQYRTTGSSGTFIFGDQLWNQAAVQPTIMFWGQTFVNAEVGGIQNDTSVCAAVANWGTSGQQGLANLILDNCSCSGVGTVIVTGEQITNLRVTNVLQEIGQTINVYSQIFGGTDITSIANPAPSVGQVNQGMPLVFTGGTPYPAIWELSVPTTVVATQSGAGTFTAGNWFFAVSVIGWNNGRDVLSASSATIALDGAHGVQVTWSGVAGVQGYDVWANNGGGFFRQNSSAVVGTSATFTVFANNGVPPSLTGTGLPLIDGTQVASPIFRATSTTFKSDISAGALTANRTASLPDNSGIIALSWTNANVTPVTVNTSTLSDQNLMNVTVPANTLNVVGRTLRMHLSGLYSLPVSAGGTKLEMKVKLGTLTLIDIVTSAADAGGSVTNNKWLMDAYITTQTAGASSAFEASGQLLVDLGALNSSADTVFPDNNQSTIGTLDTTANQTLQITIAFSNASGSNSCTQRQMVLDTTN